jgi:hypothetical protein
MYLEFVQAFNGHSQLTAPAEFHDFAADGSNFLNRVNGMGRHLGDRLIQYVFRDAQLTLRFDYLTHRPRTSVGELRMFEGG